MASSPAASEDQKQEKLTIVLGNQKFPGYFDYPYLHPLVLTFLELMGFFGLSSIGNPLFTNWELDHDAKTVLTVMMIGSRRHKKSFGTHMPSAPYLPVELWDQIVDEFIVPSCEGNSHLNFEPLRVNSQFIDIVQKLDGHIYKLDGNIYTGYYKKFRLSVVDIPFNREFYIGVVGPYEEIFFVDDWEYDGHTQYFLKYKNHPDWVPGDQPRLVEFCDNGLAYCDGHYCPLYF
jgi:hypothetical protein